MIARETETEILLCYQQENIYVSTIARRFNVHRDVVLRVVKHANLPNRTRQYRGRRIDKFIPIVDELLGTFPALTASRMLVMMKDHGYVGSSSHFRHVLAAHRRKGDLNSTEGTITKRRREWLEWLYLLERGQLPTLVGADKQTRRICSFA